MKYLIPTLNIKIQLSSPLSLPFMVHHISHFFLAMKSKAHPKSVTSLLVCRTSASRVPNNLQNVGAPPHQGALPASLHAEWGPSLGPAGTQGCVPPPGAQHAGGRLSPEDVSMLPA